MNSRNIFLISLFLLFCLSPHNLFSQAADITGWRNPNHIYCSTEAADTLTGMSPPGRPFYFNDTSYLSSTKLVRLSDGMAIFHPSRAGTGTHTIKYGNIGSHDVTMVVTVVNAATVTLAPFANACLNQPPYSLFNSDSSNVNPKTGIFTGPGVDAFGNFNPAGAGAGVHTINYSVRTGGCISTVSRIIMVVAPPVVSINPFPPVCEGSAPVTLTQGSPAGGIYSGPGISGNIFNPGATGTGNFPIQYSYSNGTCSISATRNIIVAPKPVAGISGLGPQYCSNSPAVNLLGSPAGATGRWSGLGITDNGNGTGVFSPAISGLGLHTVRYIYTTGSGCSDTAYQNVQVGTNVFMAGLSPSYCVNSGDVTITGTPAGGYYDVLPGLTDNGNGTAVFSPSAAAAGNRVITYYFRDALGCLNSVSQTVQVYALPVLSIINAAPEYCANAPVITLSGNYTPAGSFSGASVTDNGNGTAFFSPSNLAAGGPYTITYSYRDIISGCLSATTRLVMINPVPAATISGDASVCINNATPLHFTMSGASPYNLNYSDGTGTYTLNNLPGPVHDVNVFPLDTTTYRLTGITDSKGCSTIGTGSAIINVIPEVTLVSQPVSQMACVGNNVIFRVDALGSNLIYKWQKNGIDIPGALSSILAINNAQVADGGTYRCIVSGDCGPTLTSNDAMLSFWSQTVLNINPVTAHECEGENVSFMVSAGGANLVYQWYYDNTAITDNAFYSGSRTATLSITSLLTAHSGNYHCVITGSCGTVASLPAALVVDKTIVIQSQPASVTTCQGNNVSYSITATGDQLTFQWQKDNINIPGATGTTLSLTNITLPDGGFYRCHIQSPCGSELYSNPARLTLNSPVTLSSNPVSLIRCEGDNATFTVVAAGTVRGFQWKKNGMFLADNGHIAGSQTASLTINNITGSDAASYQCIVDGVCNPMNSLPASLGVDTSMVITTQPRDIRACLNDNVFFSITITGNHISCQWLKNGINLPGETSTTLVINNAGPANEGTYTCYISNSCGRNLTSDPAILRINDPVVINEQPADKEVCIGDDAIFTARATGYGLNFQWEKDGMPFYDGGNISGTQSENLIIDQVTHNNEGVYNCYVTGSCGSERSIPASLVAHDSIIILGQPAGDTVCTGFNTSFNIVASGATGYQWQKDEANLPGKNGAQLVLNGVTAADSGVYRCLVYSACGMLASDGATLFVKTFPSFLAEPSSVNACEKQTIQFGAHASGSDLTYQWLKDGTALVDAPGISGTASALLKIDSVRQVDAGIYALQARGFCGTIASHDVNLAVTPLPVVVSHPQSVTVCEGQTAGFTSLVSGTVTWQWQKDNIDIPGETGSTLLINNITLANQGIYHSVITGTCGTVYSRGALLEVNSFPALTQQPSDVVTCEGDAVMISIAVSGSHVTCQWKYNGMNLADGPGIAGSQTTTLSINPARPDQSGLYQCLVSGKCGNIQSNAALVTINENLRITSQLESATVCSGQTASLHIRATGTTVTCQWQKNGIDIPGANQPDYKIDAVVPGDSGLYRCILSGACGNLTSETVLFSVNSDIALLSQPPGSVVTCLGNTVVIGTSASGTNLRYQWLLNGTSITDDAIRQGTATPTLTLHTVTQADEGVYMCRISNACSLISTSGSLLIVNIPPAIIEQPAIVKACSGGNATFTTNASGTALAYQWQKGTSDIPGANSPVFNIFNVTANDTGLYRCLIRSACDTSVSDPARLEVATPLAITSQPIAIQNACEGTDAVFGITTSGTVISYQWKKNGTDLVNDARISGARSATLKINSIGAADGGTYTCQITGTCNNLTTNTSQLKVQLRPVIQFHPSDYSVLTGGNASFQVTATGDGLAWQWYFNGLPLADGAGISGSATSVLMVEGTGIPQQGVYHAVITGSCGIATSNPATLTLLASSLITGHPTGDTKCEGESITIGITTSGSGNTYQWKKNGVILTDNARFAGTQQATLAISGLQPADAGSYHCMVNGTENSAPAMLFVNRTTRIISSTPGDNLCTGDAFGLVVTASGDSLQYAWYKDGVQTTDGAGISGSSTSVLNINPLKVNYTGTYYCRVSGACGFANTNPAILSISDQAVITVQPTGSTVCEGRTVHLGIGATGNALTYQWFKNGSALSEHPGLTGSNGAVLIITGAAISDEAAYTCVIAGTCNTVYSTAAYVTVLPAPVITAQPADMTICRNNMASFAISTNFANVLYHWQKDGVDLTDGPRISGSATRTLQISNATGADQGFYNCLVLADCDTLSSHPASLTVYDEPVITLNPLSATLCEGDSYVFSVTATGSNIAYQWKKDGSVLHDGGHYTGTATSSLQVNTATSAESGVYTCLVSGSCHSAETTPAGLTVNKTTVILSQPVNSGFCSGDDFSLVVTAQGTNLTYRWEKDNIAMSDGAGVSGSASGALTIVGSTQATEGIYRCMVQGYCNSISSNPAEVTITERPVIISQPAGISLCEGNNVLLQISATGESLAFQWKKNGVPLSDNMNITGSSSPNLALHPVSQAMTGIYTCEVSNICNKVNSNPARLEIFKKGTILKQPVSMSKCLGDVASFSVNVAGTGLSFRWQFNGLPLVDGGKYSGTQTAVLTLNNTDAGNTGTYRCVVTDSCGSILNSEAASLVVNEPLIITAVPAGGTLCEGSSITLPVAATGSNLSYRWYRNGSPLAESANIIGTTASSLILNNLTSAQTGFYFCSVSSSCGNQVTASIPVIIRNPVQITSQPGNLDRCEGDMALFSITATGDSLAFQWEMNGFPLTDNAHINGSQSSLLILNSLTISDAGSYRCVVTGSCGRVNSAPAALTMKSYPAAGGIINGPIQVCEGSEGMVFTVPAMAGADYYQWSLPPGATVTTGQNTRRIELSFALHELGGPVRVAGINSCGSGPSSPILNVMANPVPVAYAGENSGICDDHALLTATLTDTLAVGLWKVINGPAVIQNPGMTQTEVHNLRMGENRFSWTVTRNGCVNVDTLTIYNNHLIIEAGNDTSVCDHIYSMRALPPAAASGEWSIIYGSGYNISRYNPNTLVSGLSRGKNIFRWSVNYNGCVSYDTVVITNNMPTDAEAGNDQILNRDNTNLNANNPAIGTGEWSLLNGSAVIDNRNRYNSLVTSLGKGKNMFAWNITFAGCVSSDTVMVNNVLADSTDAGPNQTICSNMVRLNARNPYPGYGEWSVRSGSATFINNSQYNTFALNLAQGENVLVWTAYLNGMTSDSVIIINDLPTAANAGVNISLCADSVMLNANLSYIGTGLWSIISGSGVFENPVSNITRVNNLARGNNNFKWTITNGSCKSSSAVTITNNEPTSAEAGFDVVICEDTLVLNPNVPTFGKGEWSVASGSARFAGNVARDLSRDNNLLVYSIKNAGCYSRDTLIVTSNKPSQAKAGADMSVCQDSAFLIANQPVTGSGTWSLQSGSAQIQDLNMANSPVTDLGQGINIFRWTIEYMNCISSDDMTVSNDFVRANAGTDKTLCSEGTILEANDAGYSEGTWTLAGGNASASLSNPHAPNATVQHLAYGSNTLRWTIIKNSCVSVDEVTITNNLPTPSFAGEDTYLCDDRTSLRAGIVLQGQGTWSVLSGSGTLSDSHNAYATVTNLGLGANILRWTTEKAGCISTDEVIISNNKPVFVYAGLDQAICADSTSLYANQPSNGTGTWSVITGSAAFADDRFYNSAVTGLGNGLNRLKWTVSNTGCSESDTVILTNNLPTIAIAGSDYAVCNSQGSLNANNPRYGTGEWSLISGAGVIENPFSTQTTITDLSLGNNSLRWTITNQNCTSSDDILIINNSPTVAVAGADFEVCGNSAVLFANSPVVGSGHWEVISGNAGIADSLSFNTTAGQLSFGPNTLRWITQNGICETSDDIIIKNNLAFVNAGEDVSVYEEATVLSGNNPENGTGQWVLVAGDGLFASPSSFTTEVSHLAPGLNTFEWTIENAGCTARDLVTINFKIMPKVAFEPDLTEGCPGMTVAFVNATRYGTTYLWEMGDGTTLADVNVTHTYHVAGNYRVRLTAFGPDNRVVRRDTLIIIHRNPVADFQFAPDTAFVNRPLRCYNYSFEASAYTWDFGDNTGSDEASPIHIYESGGEFNIRLIAASASNCTDTMTYTVYVAEDGKLIFPNAFTPNPDGPNGGIYSDNDRSNDVFHPYAEGIAEYHLEIYSRWGILLFESTDLNTGWDGYYKGKLLGKDVYVWRADGKFISGSAFMKTGSVLLIK